MARKFLTAVDLGKNELQNAAVHNLASAPASPVKGQMYYNTTGGDDTLYWWNGTAWVAAKASGGSSFPGYGSVVSEATFGGASSDGVSALVARADHKHANPLHDAAAHSGIPLSALSVPLSNLSMNGFVLNNVGAPSIASDAANKGYVDNAIAGLSWKEAVRVASTAQVALTGLTAIDGVTPIAGNRILLKNQTAPAENGIWIAASGAWARAGDADIDTELNGAAVFVEEGTTNQDTAWSLTTNLPITVGTTALAWAQFAGGGAVTAGAGMTQSGNTLNVIGDTSITVGADSITRAALTGDVTAPASSNATTIANDAVTNAKLANMAGNTIKVNNTGIAGDPVDVDRATFAVMMGAWFPTRYVTTNIGTGTAITVTHNLNSWSPIVEVFATSGSRETVECDVERTTQNSITLRFATAVADNQYSCVVIG